MKVTAQGSASGTPPNTGIVDSTWRSIQVTLDGQNLYLVRPTDWRVFSSGLLASPRPFPALPMASHLTAAANMLGLDQTFLNPGERQQVLMSLILLASQIPDTSFLNGATFPDMMAWPLFCDHTFTDPLGNSVYVLDLATTGAILADPAALATMVGVGYLFRLELIDDSGNTTHLLYRPFNTGFAESSRWPDALQRLHEHIEKRR